MNKVLLVVLSFILFSFNPSGYIPKEDQIVLESINKTAESIKKKYDIDPIGYGMDGKFRYLEISFQSFKRTSQDEAREILINCVDEFLQEINSNESLRPFLKNYPFTYKNAGICIYFRNINGKDFKDPDICVAESSSSGLSFKTHFPDKEYGYKECYEETHEEALSLVEKTRQITDKKTNKP